MTTLRAPSLERDEGVTLMFTGRTGGTSQGPYRGLNLSFNVGDRAGDVLANRQVVADLAGIALENWVACRQVHGSRVLVVSPLDLGNGAYDYESAVPDTDGAITDIPGVALLVLTADCVPVAFASPGGRVVGVAHAGWRGVLAGVLEQVLEGVVELSGSEPRGIRVFIGPHIRRCCFAVGDDVSQRFSGEYPGVVVDDAAGEGEAVDLSLAIRYLLERRGVVNDNVFESGACTCCDKSYFSHRRSGGVTGRQAALIAISGSEER